MSQRNVERVIGRLVTDEPFRLRFAENPGAILREISESCMELTEIEIRALAGVDLLLISEIAEEIDPRIQRVDGSGVAS